MSHDNRDDNIFGGGEKFFDVFRIDAAVDVVFHVVVRHSLRLAPPPPKLDPWGR